MSSSVLTRIAGRALVADCDKGDFIVERLQPLIVLPRALETAVVINVSEGWKYVKADKCALCERCSQDIILRRLKRMIVMILLYNFQVQKL